MSRTAVVFVVSLALFSGAPGCGEGTPGAPTSTGGSSGSGGSSGGASANGGASVNGGTSGGASASAGTPAGGAVNASGGSGTTSSGGAAVNGGASSGGNLAMAGGGGLTAGAGGGAPGGAGSGNSWDGCDEFVLPPDCSIPSGAVLPGELRCTGLYSNFEARTLRCGVKAYEPAHELWSDGARKQRYVWLPPGKTIDVSNGDDFNFPVGTRFWKEFYVGPADSQILGETRLLLRAEAGWLYTAYVWDRAGTTATQHNDGVDDLFETGHSVPSREQCKTCHIGRPNFILGWDFIMLGEGATGVTARGLAEEGRFSGLDPAHLELAVPGDEVERNALAYLHANCGVSCHNTTIDATGNPSGLFLRLEVDAMSSPQATGAALGINQRPGPNAKLGGLPDADYYDFRPGDPERSLSLARMGYRGSETAMPPIGTHVVDPAGVEAVRAWIASMTEERGYPAPAP